jgi:hypothetical protein
MASLNIFIPRILSNVSKKTIFDTFDNMNIGEVIYIDMHKRMNERRNVYSFAFLNIELNGTPKSTEISDAINKNGSMRLYYDDEHYWELKHYIPYKERNHEKYLEIEELCKLLTKVPSCFNENDYKIMETEFEELQHETSDLLEISNAIYEKPIMKYYSLF